MSIRDMLTNYTVFDYETKDPYISKGMGGGWVYKINYPELCEAFVVGLGYYEKKFDMYSWINSDVKIFNNKTLIAHNLIYDLGWWLTWTPEPVQALRSMYQHGYILIDTMILAKLVNEHDFNYSLANLAKKYKVSQKTQDKLADAVFETGLYTELRSTEKAKFVNRPKDNKQLLKMAYENMNRLPEEVVKEYCLDDVKATKELYECLMEKLLQEYTEEELYTIIQRYSTLQYVMLEMRLNGCTIDNNLLRQNQAELFKMLQEAQQVLNDKVGMDVNAAPSDSLEQAFRVYGYSDSDFERTKTGKVSMTQEWLKDHGHCLLCKQVLRVRKLNKILSTFIENLRVVQDELQLSQETLGKVYGEFNIAGARTGRFSSSNPNLQQIPKRSPEFYKVCRSMFVAEPGRKLVASDYSNQEQRIQVHYGKLLNCDGADEVCAAWNADPKLDFHKKVADLCNIDRTHAKEINLGKSYGMGEAKLCKKLGLPTYMKMQKWGSKLEEREVAGREGKIIIDKYNTMFPFLSQATQKCREVQERRGYLKSLGGRHLHPEQVFINGVKKEKYFKAFSQLIQGSAADMLIQALVVYYETVVSHNCDIQIHAIVHDEIVYSVPEETAKQDKALMEKIMQEAFRLELPVLVESYMGNSWYEEKNDG